MYHESHHSCAFCLSPFGLHVDDTLAVFIFYVRISRILYALMYLPNRGNNNSYTRSEKFWFWPSLYLNINYWARAVKPGFGYSSHNQKHIVKWVLSLSTTLRNLPAPLNPQEKERRQVN